VIASDSVPTSVDRLALPTRTDGRTDGLTKNWETERTSGTFRNAHTRVPDSAAVEIAELDSRPEVERLRDRVAELESLWRSALGAVRLLARDLRAERAKR
jgi:hypothetical protein